MATYEVTLTYAVEVEAGNKTDAEQYALDRIDGERNEGAVLVAVDSICAHDDTP